MKCVICHGDEIISSEIKEELVSGTDIVQVPIRVLVCQQCGERYYDRRTMRLLDELEGRLKRNELPLKEVGRVLLCTGT